MSLTLRQTQRADQRVDLRQILPETLQGMDRRAIQRLPLFIGNRKVDLGELFELEGDPDDDVMIVPLDGRLDYIGAGMQRGRIKVSGAAGNHAGSSMRGGSLLIDGDAGDFAGSGLLGGQLQVRGNAGDRVGAPPAGEIQGQRGGLIHVRGRAGERTGERQRRGLLVIEGDCGALLGHRMIAGSIYVGGRTGELAGHGMRRGSLLLRNTPTALPTTVTYNGSQRLAFLPLLLGQLHRVSGETIAIPSADTVVERYLGDLACDGRGEILIIP